ncbi:LytR C-terminal domain-containing protein [Ilumatobacter fluminis]|uniref:LytR C-terminal domain-containing protein n=1 Tax=Ilumatobacter fluminis TaxID=467091 RepID=UPI001061208C|nr:LytR C-terminal domain-containing protein [Ilumatobacter fluminis]
MKPTVVVTVITFILAAAAGVAIAGLPSEAPGADIRITEIQTVTPTTTLVLAPLEVSPLVDDEATATTEPAPETSTTTSTTSTTTTLGPPTTSAFLDSETTTTTTSTVVEDDDEIATGDVLREREALVVATANATDVGGVAGAHAEELQGYGYVNVAPVDTTPSAESAVYYQPGFDLEAARMAEELGWGLLAIAPYAELSALQTDATFELVALVGLDQV